MTFWKKKDFLIRTRDYTVKKSRLLICLIRLKSRKFSEGIKNWNVERKRWSKTTGNKKSCTEFYSVSLLLFYCFIPSLWNQMSEPSNSGMMEWSSHCPIVIFWRFFDLYKEWWAHIFSIEREILALESCAKWQMFFLYNCKF